mgnify:FL=1
MSTKKITTITLAALCLPIAIGCSESTDSELQAIARPPSPAPVLTSTAPAPQEAEVETASPKPVVAEPAPVAPDEPETEKPLVETESAGGLDIRRFATTAEIDEREPVAPTAVFDSGVERIYAFFDISNESDEAQSLLVYFVGPNAKVSGGIELEIPASVPRWRTWAYTRHAKQPGLWRVEVRDLDGELIGALPFEVQPSD